MTLTRRLALFLTTPLLLAAPSAARAGSLPSVASGHRPGPDLLYAKPASAPQLSNRAPWRAAPILISGATAYRSGEFLYQDYLYDDNGAQGTPDPTDPRSGGNTFSKQNGTYTYPTDPRYAQNAADLVELRVRAARTSTSFRVTLNTLNDPSLVAFAIAIGGTPGKLRPFPLGANVSAPADLFVSVHPRGGEMVAELTNAATGRRVRGSTLRVRVDRRRRQISVTVSHKDWNPRRRTVRLAAGVGLWNAARGRYLLPGAIADATTSGGAGTAGAPAAFFNVAFRTAEPRQSVTEGTKVLTDPAWWRDRAQGAALAKGDISPFFARVSFAKLAARVRDDSRVPRTGAFDRILPSHFETAQGASFARSCLGSAATCRGQYTGRLEPYAIYVPPKPRPAAGFGLTLLLHSLSANYNQYLGSRNQSEFGDRGAGSIVITPEARGPDEFYENYGAADVFDVWNDVARRYRLDPATSVITGYSMGGFGTFKLGAQFPDLFARAQPTVGTETNADVLASFRNLPVLMWNNVADELVPFPEYTATAAKLASLGYRNELDIYRPCASAGCSPITPNHLELAVNDEYGPAAAFLGTAKVDRSPPRVTYAVDPTRDHANLGVVANHAYWVSGVKLRGSGDAQIDASSKGFGVGDPPVTSIPLGSLGTLTGGHLGPIQFARQGQSWGAAPVTPKADAIDITATNVAAATIDPRRARITCNASVQIRRSDGPIAITLAGCGRMVRAG